MIVKAKAMNGRKIPRGGTSAKGNHFTVSTQTESALKDERHITIGICAMEKKVRVCRLFRGATVRIIHALPLRRD